MSADVITQVEQTLAALGERADDVADSLRAKAIKGVRMDDTDCPLARLLLQVPGVEQVEVGSFSITLYPSGTDGTFKVGLPAPVSQFAWWFDQGLYLDLVEIPAVAA